MEYTHTELTEIFKTASAKVLAEINREAETMLQAQLVTALAGDQRALVFASLVGAVLAIMIGGVATIASNDVDISQVLIVVAPMGALFVASLIFALIASRPIQFAPAGNSPSQWIEDIKSGQSYHDSMAEMASFYVVAIKENQESMANSAEHLKRAMQFAVGSLVVGLLALFGLVTLS